MKFNELMNGFGREIGVEGVVPDDAGTCRFQVADTELAFTGIDDAGVFATWAEIGELPVDGRLEFMRRLLAAMRPGGELDGRTVFTVFPDSDTLAVCRTDSLEGMGLPQFLEQTEAFYDLVDGWRRQLVDFTPSTYVAATGGDDRNAIRI